MTTERKKGNSHRLDVKLPLDLYDKLCEIALAEGAKIHHQSLKPELTSSIVYLLRLGIEEYSKGKKLSPIDPQLKKVIEELIEEKIEKRLGS